MKYIISLICSFWVIAIYCCNFPNSQGRPCETITLDCSDNSWSIDVSSLFEANLEIIPIETTDSCLVRADDKKLITDKYLYIADRISKKIFMFDWNGNYLRTIGKIGRGPGEYVDLGGLCIIQDSLYVHDRIQSKLITYFNQGKQFRETIINPPIYSSELTAVRNKLYFITNYSNDYNLISMDTKNHFMQYFLPYDSKIERKGSWWGLNRYSSVYRDSLIFTFSHNDTIYGLRNDIPVPLYYLDFSNNKLPEKFLENKGTTILRKSQTDGYIVGVDEIYNTKSFIMGGFGIGTQYFQFMFSKSNKNVVLSQSLVLNSLGRLSLNNYMPTDDDELVFFYDVLLLKQVWELILSKNDFQNPEIKEKLKQVIQNAKDDDNPIMFKIKFKE